MITFIYPSAGLLCYTIPGGHPGGETRAGGMTAAMPKIKMHKRTAGKKAGEDPFIPARNPHPLGEQAQGDIPEEAAPAPENVKRRRGIFAWFRRRGK